MQDISKPNWSPSVKAALAKDTLADLNQIKAEMLEDELTLADQRAALCREPMGTETSTTTAEKMRAIWGLEERVYKRRRDYAKVHSHLLLYGGEAPDVVALYATEIRPLIEAQKEPKQ